MANITIRHNTKETYPLTQSIINLNKYECANKTMNLDTLIPGHVAPSILDLLHSHTLVSIKIKAVIIHSCLNA